MARIIALDAGTLGKAAGKRGRPDAEELTIWLIRARADDGLIVIIPEIADYEVRRELIRAGATAGIERLDALHRSLRYVPINTEAMRRAAELWADARRKGRPTSGEDAIDADAILAAQALAYRGLSDVLTIATDNVGHLSRFVEDARPWHEITEF